MRDRWDNSGDAIGDRNREKAPWLRLLRIEPGCGGVGIVEWPPEVPSSKAEAAAAAVFRWVCRRNRSFESSILEIGE